MLNRRENYATGRSCQPEMLFKSWILYENNLKISNDQKYRKNIAKIRNIICNYSNEDKYL